jgi:hypothetical protein
MSKRLAKTLLPSVAIAALAMATLPSHEAEAQSNAKAEELNNKGKGLFKERRYLEAYRAFKQATELSPEGRFYFNLCFSLNYLERFAEAIDACEQVGPHGADDALMEKTNAVLEALRAKVPSPPPPDPNNTDPNNTDPNNTDPNNTDPNNTDPNNTDPNNTDPNNTDPNNTGPADPSTGPATVAGFDPFAEKKAPSTYKWSLGAGLAPINNIGLGRGSSDFADTYSGNGARINLFANFMYREAQRIGLQGYFGYTTIGADLDGFDALSVLDFGGAAFKHFGLAKNLDLTPLFGVQVSLLQPELGTEEALIALGARAQVSLDYALGKNKEHVISLAPTLSFYSASSDGNEIMASTFGLDEGGATLEFGLSYQYRFKTPFGSSPLFTLE